MTSCLNNQGSSIHEIATSGRCLYPDYLKVLNYAIIFGVKEVLAICEQTVDRYKLVLPRPRVIVDVRKSAPLAHRHMAGGMTSPLLWEMRVFTATSSRLSALWRELHKVVSMRVSVPLSIITSAPRPAGLMAPLQGLIKVETCSSAVFCMQFITP